jgi:hypothetical protein
MISDLEFGIADLPPTHRPLFQAIYAYGRAVICSFRRPSEFEFRISKWAAIQKCRS